MFIGLLSGTSMDAVDCALVHFEDERLTVIDALHYPIPSTLKCSVKNVIAQKSITFETLAEIDHDFAECFAGAVLSLLEKNKTPPSAISAIGSHGQNLWHNPNRSPGFTLQIGDPNWIATKTGIPTIADFRRKDMALGGQGAPLVPRFHAAFFQHAKNDRAVINLGGICNISLLPKDKKAAILGWDIGPANALLDALCEHYFQKPYDNEGSIAESGRSDTALLKKLRLDPYFKASPPKSTGKEYFNLQWLKNYGTLENKADLLATVTELTAGLIAETVQNAFQQAEVLICGGGVLNAYLMERIKHHLNEHYSVHSTAHYGMDPTWVEACCFAWLAKQHLLKLPGNLPSVTGASRETVLGVLYTP